MDTNTKEVIKKPIVEKPKTAVRKVDVKEFIKSCAVGDDPIAILQKTQDELDSSGKIQDMTTSSSLYKVLTLFEFDKGLLASAAIPEKYRSFCIDFNRNLQKEYQCETPSEKATAELVAVNFIRTLEIQNKINSYLGLGNITDMGVKYLAVLSKELDRANRHYLNTLQTLKMIKLPALEVNIKTQTAIVGQNQIVQSNNK